MSGLSVVSILAWRMRTVRHDSRIDCNASASRITTIPQCTLICDLNCATSARNRVRSFDAVSTCASYASRTAVLKLRPSSAAAVSCCAARNDRAYPSPSCSQGCDHFEQHRVRWNRHHEPPFMSSAVTLRGSKLMSASGFQRQTMGGCRKIPAAVRAVASVRRLGAPARVDCTPGVPLRLRASSTIVKKW